MDGWIHKDPTLYTLKTGSSPLEVVIDSLERSKLSYKIFYQVEVEPTDRSFKQAIQFASQVDRPFDAFVGVGGGSTLDTAKAANLYSTYPPSDFLDYVNPPIGKGNTYTLAD